MIKQQISASEAFEIQQFNGLLQCAQRLCTDTTDLKNMLQEYRGWGNKLQCLMSVQYVATVTDLLASSLLQNLHILRPDNAKPLASSN